MSGVSESFFLFHSKKLLYVSIYTVLFTALCADEINNLYLPPSIPWGDSPELLTDTRIKNAAQYAERAKILFREKDYYYAQLYIKKALKIDPENHSYDILHGDIEYETREYYRAEDSYTTAFLKRPRDIVCLNRLIDALIKLKKFDKALKAAEYYILLDKSGYLVDLKKGMIFFYSGKSPQAEKRLKSALKKFQIFISQGGGNHAFDVYYFLSELYLNADKYEDARKNLTEMLAVLHALSLQSADSPAVFSSLIIIEKISVPIPWIEARIPECDMRAVEKRFYNLLFTDKEAKEAGYSALPMHEEQIFQNIKNKRKELDLLTEQAKTIIPSDARIPYLHSLSAAASGNLDQAISLAAEAFKINPHLPGPWLITAYAYRVQKKYTISYSFLKAGENFLPGNTAILKSIIHIALETESILLARIYLKRFLGITGAADMQNYTALYANLHFRTGLFNSARLLMTDKINSYPELKKYGEIQFAFNLLHERNNDDALIYFQAIAHHDHDLFVNGRIKGLIATERFERAVRELYDYLSQTQSIPVFNMQLMLDARSAIPSQLWNTDTNAKQITQFIALQYGSWENLEKIILILTGDLPPVLAINAKPGAKPLFDIIRYAMINTKSRENRVLEQYVKRYIRIIIAQGAQDSLVQKYCTIFYNIKINQYLRAHKDGDVSLMDTILSEIKSFMKTSTASPSNRFILDYMYMNEIRSFIIDRTTLLNQQRSDDTNSYEKFRKSVFSRYHNTAFFYEHEAAEAIKNKAWYKIYESGKALTELFPGDSSGYYYKAVYFYTAASVDTAVYYIKKAIHIDREIQEYYFLYARIMILNKKPREAWAILQKGIMQCTDNESLHLLTANLYFDQGEYSHALERYRQLLFTHSADARLYHNMGVCLISLKRFPEAVKFLNIAGTYSDMTADTLYYTAKAWYGHGDYNLARAAMNSALEILPDEPVYLYASGRIYEKLMIKGSPSMYEQYRLRAQAAYRRILEITRFYDALYGWARERLDSMQGEYIVRSVHHFPSEILPAAEFIRFSTNTALIVPFKNSELMLFEMSTRNIIWKRRYNGSAVSCPAVGRDSFLLPMDNHCVYHIKISDGALLQQIHMPAGADSAQFLDPVSFTVSSSSGEIFTYKNNTQFAGLKTSSVFSCAPFPFGDTVYTGQKDGQISCYDLFSEKLNWSCRLSAPPGGNILAGGKNIFFGTEDNFFYALDKKTGSFDFKYNNNYPPTEDHIWIDDKIVYATTDGFLRMIDQHGAFYWEHQLQSPLCAPMRYQNSTIIAPLRNSSITLLSYKDGTELMTLRLNSPAAAAPVYTERNMLDVLTLDGLLTTFYLNIR